MVPIGSRENAVEHGGSGDIAVVDGSSGLMLLNAAMYTMGRGSRLRERCEKSGSPVALT